MFRRTLAILATAAAAAAGLLAFQAVAPQQIGAESASAATATFDPGNIISDENFYDGSAMTAAEVQQFLVSKNGSSSSTALRNYTQSTPSMPATSYCSAYQGAPGGETAANIIAKVGQACNFSAKAMLVLLEKEQSLVSMSSPTLGRLAAATGFGCPDTAPCDASYGGFFYQVYNAARQFQYYKANPYSFNHIPFATNNVLYNPNFSCGSSPVYISNYATAGLYNYTPYQPNNAALSNMYGEGDGCSAYGNRNFWRMYTDWFGDAQGTATRPSLIQAEGTSDVYFLSDGVRYHVTADRVATFTAALGAVETIPAQEMSWIPWGTWVGEILEGPDGPVYLSDGKWWKLRGWTTAASYGYPQGSTAKITKEQLEKFEGGWTLESFVQTDNGQIFLVQNQTKREVSDLGALRDFGMFTAVTKLKDGALDFLPAGEPVLTRGAVVTPLDGSQTLVLGDEARGYVVSDELKKLSEFSATAKLGDAFAQVQAAGSLDSALVSDGSATYLITDAGLLQVPASTYGVGAFTPVPADALVGLDKLGSTGGAHLVKEVDGSKVNLVVGGERVEYASEDDAKAEAKRRGTDETVYTTANGTLSDVPTGNGITNGAVLKTPSSDELYVLDGAHLVKIANIELAKAYGFGSTPLTMTQASFDKIPKRDTTIDSAQFVCNGVTLLAAEGQGHPYLTQELQAAYGLESETLSPQLCGVIGVSEKPATEFITTASGAWYAIIGAEKRLIGWPAVGEAMGMPERGSLQVVDSVADAIPTGSLLVAAPEGWPLPDVTTPTPTPTAEPTPTATPTVEPTETPAPTATPTLEPTPTATESTTPAPTSSETASPEPTETAEPAVPLESGDLIADKAGTGIWIVNGEELLQIGSRDVAAQIGLPLDEVQTVPAANFAAFEGKTSPLYTSAVMVGDVPYIGVDGQLVPFATPENAAAFGLVFTPLAPEVGVKLSVASDAEPIGDVVQGPDEQFYRVIDGKLSLIDPSLAAPTDTAIPTESVLPSETEAPSETELPSETPAPSDVPGQTDAAPTATSTERPAESTEEPTATQAPESTPDEEPTTDPEPTEAPEATPAPTFRLSIELFSIMGLGTPVAE